MRRTASALSLESEEVPVSSTELIEANVVATRADLSDFRVEFRGVVVRIDQDIRELRADNKTLRDKIDANYSSLDNKIDAMRAVLDETRESLDRKIDATRDSLDKRIDATRESLESKFDSLDKKIDATTGELRADVKAIQTSVSDLKAMVKAILWLLGVMGTLASVGLPIAKTLDWI
jgi:DNA anti-recombination protein RmuC